MKVLNPIQSPMALWRNSKIADIFPCVTKEEIPITQGLCKTQNFHPTGSAPFSVLASDPMQLLGDCGLAEIDIEGCEVSDEWKRKLAKLF